MEIKNTSNQPPPEWVERMKRIRESGCAEEPGKMTYSELLQKWRQKYSADEMAESAKVIEMAVNREANVAKTVSDYMSKAEFSQGDDGYWYGTISSLGISVDEETHDECVAALEAAIEEKLEG